MTVTLATLPQAINKAVEKAVVASIKLGLVPDLGVEITDRVRVDTGANRASTTASPGKPNIVTLSRDVTYPAKSRGEFESEIRGLKFKEDAYLTQGQDYSAPRESLDGAVAAGIRSTESRWDRVGERAIARGVK